MKTLLDNYYLTKEMLLINNKNRTNLLYTNHLFYHLMNISLNFTKTCMSRVM